MTTPIANQPDPPAQYVNIDGERYCYRMIGEGPSILLIHGITDSSRYFWREFFSHFSTGYSIAAIDLRGHGCSAKLKKGYSTLELVDLIIKFMNSLKLDRTMIIGHSLGGIISTKLTMLYPHRVSKLIIYDSPLGDDSKKDLIRLSNLPLGGSVTVGMTLVPLIGRYLYSLRSPATVRMAVEKLEVFYDNSKISDELVEEKLKCSYDAFYQSFWRVVISEHIEKDLGLLSLPTLVICGSDDPFVTQEDAKNISNKIVNSQLHIIQKAGHFPLIEQPNVFNQVVSQFISNPM